MVQRYPWLVAINPLTHPAHPLQPRPLSQIAWSRWIIAAASSAGT